MSVTDNRLILLGTKGGPRISKGSSWPTSNILVVEGRPYLIDAGLGVSRQAGEAGFKLFDLDRIFITHLHSDHVLELGGLIHTAWMSGPVRDVRVVGPEGLGTLFSGFFQSQSYDIDIRVADEGVKPLSDLVSWTEINRLPDPEVQQVYEDERVKVSCMRVIHPPVHPCFAYKFESAAGTVVFGADTTYYPPLADFARGADVLVHECMYVPGAKKICEDMKAVKPTLWEHFEASHTTCEDVGLIAAQADCKHLVLNHYVPDIGDRGTVESDYTDAVRLNYGGRVTAGRDLMEIAF